MSNLFSILQRVGRSFMLPIAVLPIAGLLLGISSSAGNFGPLPETLNALMIIMSSVSGIIFANLPIVFAMGVALGMAKKEKEVATLSAGIAYFVMNAAISAMLTLNGKVLADGSIAKDVLPGMITSSVGITTLQMGVFGGVIVGLGVAYLHNRFYMLELPDMISFFGGTRFVPIISTIVFMFVGIFMYFVWPPVQVGIYSMGNLIAGSGYIGTLIFGIIKRALIPLGLHHVFYTPFWQTALGGTMEVAGKIVEGGQNIFFAQLANAKDIAHFSADATRYFSGEFIFMIFGLPGAALAMYKVAKPEKKKAVGGLLFSAALTSMLTGITEPIEFSFIFAAPILYIVQVVLAGSAYMLAHMLNIAVGLTFSGGFLDLLFFGILQGNDKTSWMLIIPAGIAYFIIYYAVFYMLITKLNLPTPGREDGEETKMYSKADVQSKYAGDKKQDKYAAIAAALGGKHNIESLDCCATRLRLNVKDGSMLDEAALKANGAKAVLKDGNAVQIIFGPKVTVIKAKLQDYLEQCGDTVEVGNKVMPEAKAIVEKTVAMPAVKIAVEKTEAVAVAELPASDGPMEIITGQTVVGGIAVAKLHVAAKREEIVKRNADVKTELARLENTLEAVKADMEADAKTADTKSGEVLSAQLMMLEDDSFVKTVQANINEQKCCAEYAALLAGKSLAEEFKHMDSAYMQARSEDMEQIAQRVIDKLTGFNSKLELSEPVILVAEEFTPAQLAALDKNYVKGLVAHKGNASSHTAILAANYGLPYIFGIEPKQAYNGIGAIIDADNGKLALNPDEEYLALAKEKLETQAVMQSQSRASTKMEVYANISSAEDVEQALAKGADGVGLFRTEFLFMKRTSAPTEEEQYEVYKKVLEAMGDKPVIIRTIDIGTDKPAPYLHLPKEENPALGLRGVRVSLADKDLFSTQLKALLRASCYGNAHVMFPMITSVKEIMAIKEQIKLAEEELKAARVAYKLPKLGIMVETPAAAVWSEELAKHVDFFSIGTNDLTQYTLALDRQAEGMEVYYEPHHEAVLKLIEMTIAGGHKQCIPVGICGQLGGDVAVIPRLVQNGLDEVSVAIASIPKVRHAIIEAEKTIYVPDNTTIATSADELQLIAPVPGELVPMGDIPDATFAQGILGQCFGVKPSCGQICSPVNGVVMTVAATRHAVSIKADNGQEVLIHIGIDTVQLAGKGFNVQVKAGQRVAVGDALVETDLDTITAAGYNPMVITILLDTEGEAQEAEQETMVFEGTSFTHVVKDPVGIHARPAGEIVGLVKELNCNVQICCGEKTADGKSVIQLMKLGATKGSELEVKAEGNDAGKAIACLQQFMRSKL